MERLRVCLPPLQDLVHELQEPQPLSWQSIGQWSVLHCWCDFRAGQPTPPCWAEWVIRRVRSWIPVPQLREQALQAPQPDTWQSVGQAWELQCWVCLRSPQAWPPCWAWRRMPRERV